MEIAALILGVLGLIIAFIAFVLPWWDTVSTRVRQAVRDAEPQLYFHVSSDNYGSSLNLQNKSDAAAHNLKAYLPGMKGPAWQTDVLAAHSSLAPAVALPSDTPLRRELIPHAEVVLTYHDRLGLHHEVRSALRQMPRDDGSYNFGLTEPQVIERPTIRFREIWRLRTRV